MTKSENKIKTGGCYCGSVRFEISGPLRNIIHCHCTQCQQLNGNFGSHSKALRQDIVMTNDTGLTWYQITEFSRRGFCLVCGSSLFWESSYQEATAIIAGALDGITGLKTVGHIFVEEKADYYNINDGAPQFPGSSQGTLDGDIL